MYSLAKSRQSPERKRLKIRVKSRNTGIDGQTGVDSEGGDLYLTQYNVNLS